MITGATMVKRLAMRDTGHVGTLTPYADGPNPNKGTWSWGDAIRCGYYPANSREVSDGSQVTLSDGEIIVPLDTAVDGNSRFKLTKRMGTTLVREEIYAVLGAPKRDATHLSLNCRRLTGNSAL